MESEENKTSVCVCVHWIPFDIILFGCVFRSHVCLIFTQYMMAIACRAITNDFVISWTLLRAVVFVVVVAFPFASFHFSSIFVCLVVIWCNQTFKHCSSLNIHTKFLFLIKGMKDSTKKNTTTTAREKRIASATANGAILSIFGSIYHSILLIKSPGCR